MSALGIAGAKAVMHVMPPPAVVPEAAVPQPVADASPSAEAVIPPAVAPQPTPMPKPPEKPVAAATTHHTAVHHSIKFTAMVKHLTAPHPRPATEHTIAVRAPAVEQPPASMPPPGYYNPSPYQQLVYGGPPPGMYGGWGYRGRGPGPGGFYP